MGRYNMNGIYDQPDDFRNVDPAQFARQAARDLNELRQQFRDDAELSKELESVQREIQRLQGDVSSPELQDRLTQAGVIVDEARLTHLAYAPEIAGVMLRRQQAEAIIAARQKIVHGAVSMVEMALKELDEKKIVTFDAHDKASLVSNLLIVLCSEAEAQPVINTGSKPA